MVVLYSYTHRVDTIGHTTNSVCASPTVTQCTADVKHRYELSAPLTDRLTHTRVCAHLARRIKQWHPSTAQLGQVDEIAVLMSTSVGELKAQLAAGIGCAAADVHLIKPRVYALKDPVRLFPTVARFLLHEVTSTALKKTTGMSSDSALTGTRHHARTIPGIPGCVFKEVVF